MIVDIHTHHSTAKEITAIRNLTFREAEIVFASNESGIFSVGFHPWYIGEYTDDSFALLEKWTKDPRFVAIGECGLDKNSKYSVEYQLDVFKKQIELSEKTEKPLIIHCVGCFNELFDLKKTLKLHQTWIIHGFRGKPELARQALKNGCTLSFGELFNAESVSYTPINKLYIETDESNLAIFEIYKRISEIKSCKIEQLNAGNLLIETILAKI